MVQTLVTKEPSIFHMDHQYLALFNPAHDQILKNWPDLICKNRPEWAYLQRRIREVFPSYPV